MRRAARRDENEPDVIEALRGVGASVLQAGVIDLIVGYLGRSYLLEVKGPKTPLKPSQKELLKTWQGHYAIVRTAEEALEQIGALDFTTGGSP